MNIFQAGESRYMNSLASETERFLRRLVGGLVGVTCRREGEAAEFSSDVGAGMEIAIMGSCASKSIWARLTSYLVSKVKKVPWELLSHYPTHS